MVSILCPLLLGLIFLALLWDTARWIRRASHTIQQTLAIPCPNCRYGNLEYNHLKCAVNPYQAYSPEAIDCPDFRDAQR